MGLKLLKKSKVTAEIIILHNFTAAHYLFRLFQVAWLFFHLLFLLFLILYRVGIR